MTPTRLICYSSGAWPCGIANYHRQLEPALREAFSVTTHLLPATPVLRDRPWALARRRRHYARLAGLSESYDAALLQFVTFWNGNRTGENALPTFAARLYCPTVVVLHEWPLAQEPEPHDGSWARRVVRAAALRITPGPRDYVAWLNTQFFGRMAHFIVHSTELRDRLLEAGVRADRVTLTLQPVYDLESKQGPSLDSSLVQKIDGKRVLLLFGFPHPRKNYELAIKALRELPEDIVLVMAGSLEGRFRTEYANALVALAKEHAVLDRFHTTGEIDSRALSDLFDRTAVAVAPFSYATGSASMGYFFGANLPVVASDIPSNVAVHQAGGGIKLFRQGDAGDLATAITNVLDNASVRRQLQDRTRAFARLHSFHKLGELIGDRIRQVARFVATSQ